METPVLGATTPVEVPVHDDEAQLAEEIVRLRALAEAWDRRGAPDGLDEDATARWQCDVWIGAAGLRDAALRLEDALHAIARRRAASAAGA